MKPHRAGFSLIDSTIFVLFLFVWFLSLQHKNKKLECGSPFCFPPRSSSAAIPICQLYQSSCAPCRFPILYLGSDTSFFLSLYLLCCVGSGVCVLLTGHSVTESSTRVRKDGDDVQQDLSGVVHDFMEPTLLAIPAHLKIDVSFLDALVISPPPVLLFSKYFIPPSLASFVLLRSPIHPKRKILLCTYLYTDCKLVSSVV